ncbi:lipase family protein [Herbiconiux ginsengi]|uniref:Alpha/beta hydrolase family protein n=1 Tax=Herbiconiux ginsengi TaxID=381665 RepID=A0A1H3LXC2_9MICO|nr:hypothetical protein [Herbiconiux ginsengi]SDY68445.1 hypothetical protein SAMN05216554_1153 [Herbiconiux ginsengi]
MPSDDNSREAASAGSAASAARVVLVHGAYADGSSWADVIPPLHDEGIAVTAVQNARALTS